MKTTRAKFKCESITTKEDGKTIEFTPVVRGS